ncbi:uroporphyrinogen-III synthase [Uliginosibacterium sp. H3]|uniref:Uroporphyrinogen-III synthase n=1 Tax=Uliginosibacterium silvisoli TaxID=3114758 RepID=A0ABU6JYP6_9RHOO|nr:uroporphyrinogen-III synthase [Uliginosibacterium sp. H3]
MAESRALAGRCVVVTRPAQQAEPLLEALRAAGAAPLFFPVIDIVPLADLSELQALANRLDHYDIAFFVSANAVEQTLAVIPRAAWPASVRIATVGPGSARALQAQGFGEIMLPASRFDSEGVLDLPGMQATAIAGKRVLVLRGNGGRELLAQTLVERGAQVDVVSTYERRRAATAPAELLTCFAADGLAAISFTSSEGAHNFVEHLRGAEGGDVLVGELFRTLPCFVPHPRIAEVLRALGVQNIVLTGAGDAALIEALEKYFGQEHCA